MNALQHAPKRIDTEHGEVEYLSEIRTLPTDTGSLTFLSGGPIRGGEDAPVMASSVDVHDYITRLVLYPWERKHKNGDPLKPIELRVVTHIYADGSDTTILVWEDDTGRTAYQQSGQPEGGDA